MSAATRIIGIDESGKGDFFGPLVIAGFLCDNQDVGRLQALGVRDSKKVSDSKLLLIAETLRRDFPHFVFAIFPRQYNQQHSVIKNLNKMLAAGHAEVITQLLSRHQADLAISDKFGKNERLETALREKSCDLPVKQLVRGESIPQVAAASILARAAFITELDHLAERHGVVLPKGASAQVDEAGREIVRQHGTEILEDIAKLHFKNYGRIAGPHRP